MRKYYLLLDVLLHFITMTTTMMKHEVDDYTTNCCISTWFVLVLLYRFYPDYYWL